MNGWMDEWMNDMTTESLTITKCQKLQKYEKSWKIK